MVDVLIMGLVFFIFFIIAISILFSQLRRDQIPSEFATLLKETERYSNPSLKTLQGTRLPDPVSRYLQGSLIKPDSRPSFVEVQFSGHQRLHPESDLRPVHGKNYYALVRPGFLSQSRFAWISLIWIDVIQRYSINDGYIEGKIFSIFPILSLIGLRMSRLSLTRYFSEAVWFPWIYESTPNLHWEPIDNHSAKLKVSYHPLIASFHVQFNDENQIEAISSLGQYNNQNGETIPYERIVSFGRYQQNQGISLPQEMNVVWRCSKEERILQQLTITNIIFHYNSPAP